MPKDDKNNRTADIDGAMTEILSELDDDARRRFKDFLYLLASENADTKEPSPFAQEKA